MSEQQPAGLPEGPYTAEPMSQEYLPAWQVLAADGTRVAFVAKVRAQEAEAIAHHIAASWQTARDLRTALAFIVEAHTAWRAWWDGDGRALADMGPAFDLVMAELMPEGGTE